MIFHKRNSAYYLSFPMVDSSLPSSFKTGVSPVDTAYYKDGAGAWTSLAISDTATEIGSTGMYEIDLSASEMNHDLVIIKFSVAGASDTAFVFNMVNNEYVADSVWDEDFASHNSGGTFGKAVKQLNEGIISVESTVNDVAATTTAFITDLTESTDSHYSDQTLMFIDGALQGQCKPILSYNGTTKTITLDEALSEAPSDGDSFVILCVHVHPVTQIAQGVRTEMDSNSTQLAAIKAVSDGVALTSLALASSLATVDSNLDLVLVDTGTDIPAQIAALNNISAADVNAEVDTAISDASLATSAEVAVIDSNVDAILADTGTAIPAQIAALNDVSVNDIVYTALTESYASAGATPTLAQALYLIQQKLGDFSITGTTLTVKQLDGSTTAASYTLNDATNPTGITRA